MRRYSCASISLAALLGGLAVSTSGCRRGKGASASPAEARIDAALRPAAFAAALRKVGGGHLRVITRLGAAPTVTPTPQNDLPGPPGPPPPLEAITTTTELWMDPAGNFRLTEVNDRDGGREVVKRGRDLFVALRYGKMIRRSAEDPEPDRILAQALGGPWAVWESLRRGTTLTPLPPLKLNGRSTTGWKIGFSNETRAEPAPETELRLWRSSIVITRVEGQLRLDDTTGLPMAVSLRGAYAMTRDTVLMRGEVDVEQGEIDTISSVPPIAPPVAFEDARSRQRTVPEERALLGGLTAGKDASRGRNP